MSDKNPVRSSRPETPTRRALRAQRRARRLALEGRWYEGGVAALLSFLLVFAGMASATADDAATPTPDSSSSQAADGSGSGGGGSASGDQASPPADAGAAQGDTTPSADPTTPSDGATPTDEATPGDDETGDGSDDQASQDVQALAEPFALLDAADPTTSTNIVVNARVIAQPTSTSGPLGTNYSYTVGDAFQLYTFSTLAAGPQAAVTDAWATCTVTAGGTCTITVPDTSSAGANYHKQFWVVQTATAAGVYSNPTLSLGSYEGPANTRYILGATAALNPGTANAQTMPQTAGTVTSATWPSGGSYGTAAIAGSYGAVANSIVDPSISPVCTAGLKVAIVADESSSIDSSEWSTFRTAIVGSGGLLDQLTGTNSSIAFFSFSDASPTSGQTNHPVPLALDANRSTINGWIPTSSSGGHTNWDSAMRAVAAGTAANDYDVVLFITDGAPNYIASGTAVSGNDVTLRSLESAIYSANAVKLLGSRIVTVGVGSGTSAGNNLRAISGTVSGSDYFQTPDWTALNDQLGEIARGLTCQVPITVTKQVPDGNGGWTGSSGWTMTATPGTPTSGTVSLNAAASQTTNASGQAAWTMAFTQPGASVGLTLAETQKTNYTFTSGSCVITHAGGGTNTVTISGVSVSLSGILSNDKSVACTFRNSPTPTTLTLVKAFSNTYGAPADPSAWTLKANSTVFSSGVAQNVAPGTYTISEVGQTGYTQKSITCTGGTYNSGTSTVTIAQSQTVVCTVTNADKPTSLVIAKQDAAGAPLDGATFQLWQETNGVAGLQTTANGSTPADTLTQGDIHTTGGSATIGSLSWSTYYVKETAAPAGYAITPPDMQTVTLGAAQTATAATVTFTDSKLVGTLQITKTIVGGGVNADATFSGGYDCGGGFSGIFATLTTSAPITVTGIPAGSSCTVFENTAPLSSSQLVNASYAWDLAHSGMVSPNPVVIVANSTVTANITNTTTRVYGGLTVAKHVVGTPATLSQVFSGTWQCTYPGDAGQNTSGTWKATFAGGVLTSTTYTGPTTTIPLTSACTVAENTPGAISDPSYTWSSTGAVSPASVTLGSDTRTAAFTVTNTAVRSSLTLNKSVDNTNGGTATASDWNGKLQAQLTGGSASTFDAGETKYLAPGTYTLTELAGGPAGYALTGLSCSVDGTSLASNTVTVGAGANVTCTFTNTAQKPTLTLQKQVDNSAGGTANANQWTLTAAAGESKPINGKGTEVLGSTTLAQISGAVTGNTTYTLSESDGPGGYTSTGQWTCTVPATGQSFPVTDGTKITPVVGTDVACVIHNVAVPASGNIVKNLVGTPTQNADGSWTIHYDITVTNTSAYTSYTYSLTDALEFGSGIAVTGATWAGPGVTTPTHDFTGTAATLASGAVLTALAHTAVYHVTVQATIADGTQDGTSWQCDSAPTPDAGGFLNSATLTSRGADDQTAYACGEPAFPTIAKTGATATSNPDGTWNAAYTVTIANPGVSAIHATLTDAWPTLPAGWTLAGGVWHAASADVTPTNPTSAATPVWTGVLPANTTYTFTITGVLVPTAAAAAIGSCDSQGGLPNTATVTSGQITQEATGCVTVTLPPVMVAKSVTGLSQAADGSWTIDYSITVTGDATAATVYTLTDLPIPGTGFSEVSHGWIGAEPMPNTPIEAGGVDTYRYRLVVSFDPSVPDPQLTCTTGRSGPFFNTATVAFPGGTNTASACAAPAPPAPTLAVTGATIYPLLGVALAVLLAGIGAVLITRRRPGGADPRA